MKMQVFNGLSCLRFFLYRPVEGIGIKSFHENFKSHSGSFKEISKFTPAKLHNSGNMALGNDQ